MMDLINPALDIPAIRGELDRRGYVQVPGFLPRKTAEDILACLEHKVAWDLAWSQDSRGRLLKARELEKMNPRQVRAAVDSAFDFSHGGFNFVYHTFKPIDSYLAGEYAFHYLYTLADALHNQQFLAFARQLTGRANIQRLDVIACRYLPGHFLTLHDDAHEGEGREVAYVLNLTEEWRPEWGGLLHIGDESGERIVQSFVPSFNSMVLFRPPRWHFVSQVANYAKRARYTITGWMLSG